MSIFSIRTAAATDAAAMGRVHHDSWQQSYGPLVDDEHRAAQDIESFTKNWRKWLADSSVQNIVAVDDADHIIGLVSFGPLRTPPPGMSPIRPLYTSEIYAIFVDPAHWGSGAADQLMAAAAHALAAQKHKSTCLWVLEGNKRALAYYKKRGGQRCGKAKVQIGARALTDIAMGWRDTASLKNL